MWRCKLFTNPCVEEDLEIEMVVDDEEITIDVPDIPLDVSSLVTAENVLSLDDNKWIVVIANATSPSSPIPKSLSESVTKKVYDVYPYANVYSASSKRQVGSTIISTPKDSSTGVQLVSTPEHRYVATLIAEHSAGGPKKIEDTIENRKKWFTTAIYELAKVIQTNDSIAIDAESLSDGYREIIETMAVEKHIKVHILGPIKSSPIKKRNTKVNAQFVGERISTIEEELKDDIARGVLYAKLMKSHRLSPEDYSKLVTHLERCIPKTRKTWLEHFVKMTHEKQSQELVDVLGRL